MGYLSERPIDPAALAAAVDAPAHGGSCTFLGTVRNRHGGREVVELEYSAYGAMAEATIAAIVAAAEARWPVRLAVVHRVGRLQVGETAVAVVAAGAHREEAFAACRHVIEELKRRVPIWKRERFADGTESWVDPTAEAVTP